MTLLMPGPGIPTFGAHPVDDPTPVIVFVGLMLEARIAVGPHAIVVCHHRRRGVSQLVEQAVRLGSRSIISFGLAGGLAPHLHAGDWIVASSVRYEHQELPTDAVWSSRLLLAVPHASYAPLAGVDSAVVHAPARGALHARTGAVAVDTESHLVARMAADHCLRFAVLRVVVDAANRRIPQTALDCLADDGSTSLTNLLRGLLASPADILDVLRLTGDWLAARASLIAVRELFGPKMGGS
jgi:hopanoid-associated phosphorylase